MRNIRSNALWALVIALGFSACKSAKPGAASGEPTIDIHEVSRIEKTLSADDMAGRKVFSPGIDKAAAFIAAEFEKAGLQRPDNGNGYLQTFSMLKPTQVSATAVIDGRDLPAGEFVVVTGQPTLSVTPESGYEIVSIEKGANIFQKANEHIGSGKNRLVMVDTSFSKNFPRLAFFKRQMMETATSTIFILGQDKPSAFRVDATHTIERSSLSNVVGILPGKSRKNEYVIFSGHYDHLGIGKPLNGDSIYNGANDDAAGTTAVIMLANYFKQLNNNERTIIFAAFTAEESGGYGATYFSRQFDPAQVMAMFNIEMIGTESKWGTNSAYITGYDKTNMGEILAKNLQGSGFTFHPDPYPDQQLFYRSDNATLARLGVPAHTISTSKMDSEKYYHTADDEFETLDMENMTRIIRAIAISSRTIVAGQDTPSRVNTSDLR
ncbi:M28 family peptidase [Flavihumibacter stibioxidans]|uniref:Aminopeptidase n=1 Tax=Flavihumibacter stibioxidans TaxID=1834163 RepID=A0ABR7MDT7_9BACT|nr:M28 family peptidase [Flavihumibacter stibioxidans]MBC6493189.1 aminopeptidase [Flavihumibacter stibioxidans]